MNYTGDYAVGQEIYVWFNTFDSNDPSASVTMTTFINTDVHIHKDDSLTQRNNAAGVTVDVDVDGIAGVHKITIDTADNTVADFYEAGHDYAVRIEGATVDAALINPVVGTFSIANRRVAGEMCRSSIESLASQTSFTLTTGEASGQDDAYNNCTIIVTDQTTRIQKAVAQISDYTGSTRTITLRAAPLATGFTMAIGDSVEILATSAFANLDSVVGTAQTAGDIGSDVAAILSDTGTDGVLISAGTGTGQVSLASGLVRLSAAGIDDVWDEATSGHVSEGSFGQHFFPAQVGTATAGAATTITLDATGRSAVDDFYNGSLIRITGGTGAGQSRFITNYDQASGVATVGTWATNPSTDSDYVITLFDTIVGATAPTADQNAAAVWDKAMSSHTSEGSFGSMIQSFQEGQTQAGSTSSTIVLDATGASATEDFYQYAVVEVLTGTAAGQSRQITAYAQASTTATVDPAWTTTPGTGDQYVIRGLGIDAATLANIADAVWDQPRASNLGAGSRGEYVFSDALRISGSATAADGLEAAVSGATPLPSNTTQWLGSAVAAVTQAGVPEVDVTFVGGVAEDLPTATNMQTIDDNVDSILTDTGTTLPAQIGTPVLADISADIAANLTAVQALNDLSVADILTTAMTESYAAEGVAPTLAQALFWLYQLPSDAYRVGTTMTVRNLAGGDAGTITLDDGANPTDINRAT